MKKIFIMTAFLMASFSALAEFEFVAGKYNVDPAHTRVSFIIPHFVISQVEGRFNDVKGEFVLNEDITKSRVDVSVPIDSIDTAVKKRDDHLKSADFLDAKKYPTMTFKSKSFKGSLQNFKVTGDLMIKDVTKEVVLTGSYTGSVKDSWNQIRAAVQATGKINRKDFNINYNEMIESGPVVGDEVTINIISEGILDKPKSK